MQALRQSFCAEVSSRSQRVVARAITYHNTWHQCRKVFWRYITHTISLFPFYAVSHFDSSQNQRVIRSTKFCRIHMHDPYKRHVWLQLGLYRKKLCIENGTLATFTDIISIQRTESWIFYLRLRASNVVRAMWCGTWRYSPRAWRPASVKFPRLMLRRRSKRSSFNSCGKKYTQCLRISESTFNNRFFNL